MALTGARRIKELAALAGFDPRFNSECFNIYDFASLVQADEREANAKVADDQWVRNPHVSGGDAIRARGKSDKQD
jgi:hypothetical protein